MFTAYLDESFTNGRLVLAGYISDTERWAKLADEWASLLAMRSPHYVQIEEFHMTEMHSTPERLEMCSWYYALIEKYVQCAASICVNLPELAEEHANFRWPTWLSKKRYLKQIDNPYLQAFIRITTGIARLKDRLGIDGPIDFVFDEKTDKKHCLLAWEVVMDGCKARGDRHLYGDAPIFRESQTMMPLQAADLFAYWIRRWEIEGGKGRIPFPWKAHRAIPTLILNANGEHFRTDWRRNVGIATLQRSGWFTFSQAEKIIVGEKKMNPAPMVGLYDEPESVELEPASLTRSNELSAP